MGTACSSDDLSLRRLYANWYSCGLVVDRPERFRYEATRDRAITAAPTIQEVNIAVRSSTCALKRAERKTMAPSTIFTNSAKVEDAVVPAQRDAAMTRTPSVINTASGAPGIQSGDKAK